MNHRSKFPEAVQSPNPVESYGKTVTGNAFCGKNRNRENSNDTGGLATASPPWLRKLRFYLGRKYIYIYFLYIYTRIREAFFSSSRALNTQKQNRNLVTGAFLRTNPLISLEILSYGLCLKVVTKTVTLKFRVLEVAHV